MGRWGSCSCTPAQLDRYRRRLSAPLLDRFDLRLDVDPPDASQVLGARPVGESTAAVRDRVAEARRRARHRGVAANRMLSGAELDTHAPLSSEARELLRETLADGRLSMRGVQRVRVVALTLDDLADRSGPLDVGTLAGALMLRGVESRPVALS